MFFLGPRTTDMEDHPHWPYSQYPASLTLETQQQHDTSFSPSLGTGASGRRPIQPGLPSMRDEPSAGNGKSLHSPHAHLL